MTVIKYSNSMQHLIVHIFFSLRNYFRLDSDRFILWKTCHNLASFESFELNPVNSNSIIVRAVSKINKRTQNHCFQENEKLEHAQARLTELEPLETEVTSLRVENEQMSEKLATADKTLSDRVEQIEKQVSASRAQIWNDIWYFIVR